MSIRSNTAASRVTALPEPRGLCASSGSGPLRARAMLLAVLAVGAALSVTLPDARAAAPMIGGQAPGYYRVMVGDTEVTALSDGTIDFPMDTLLVGEAPGQIRAAYKSSFDKLPAETSMNQFLINTGQKLVLVDTGAGVFFGPTLGHTLANLRAAGYTPEQVDEVVITHMHADHTGGLVHDGARVFPNAELRIAKADVDYWMNPANEAQAPEGVRASFMVAQKAISPYISAARLKPFAGETPIVPGVRAVPAPGHTPGHSFYVVESKGEKLLLWGDMVHSADVQFADPTVRIAWDSDDRAAERMRAKVLADAAKQGYLVGGSHLPFPALGHIAKAASGKAYVFLPVSYSANRPNTKSGD